MPLSKLRFGRSLLERSHCSDSELFFARRQFSKKTLTLTCESWELLAPKACFCAMSKFNT